MLTATRRGRPSGRPFLFVAVLSLVATSANAQRSTPARTENALIGTWERISALDSSGVTAQPQPAPALLFITPEGVWGQIAIPPDRPKIDKPVNQLTREELVARFSNIESRRGTYTITGNRFIRRNTSASNPNLEGTDQVQIFRFEGDTLILSSHDPASKAATLWRRIRKTS